MFGLTFFFATLYGAQAIFFPAHLRGGKLERMVLKDSHDLTAEESSAPKWLTVPFDHFDPNNKKTFQIRYWVDESCWDGKGPIFVSMGCEGTQRYTPCKYPVGPEPFSTGQAYGALVVAVEHRGYGLSVPSSETNMTFLSVENNLADTADVIAAVKQAYQCTTCKVFTLGGSYCGATAAWFRVKYPDITVGSLASSAVVNAILQYTAFDEIIFNALNSYSPQCAQNLQMATVALEKAFANGQKAQVKRQFNASNLIGTKMGDSDFWYMVADGPAMVDQYGGKARLCEFLGKLPANPTDQQRIDNLAALISHFYGADFGSGCFYDSECFKNPQSDETNRAARSWRWEKCTEVAYLQDAPQTNRIRGKALTLNVLVEQCKYAFGNVFPATDKINREFGGAYPKGSNIFFTDYSDDPWQGASVNGSRSDSLIWCYTECTGCGHCGSGVNWTKYPRCNDMGRAYVNKWLGM